MRCYCCYTFVREVVPLSAYSLFDSGYNTDTAKEFTYTLSSQKSDTKSPLNPYMRLPITMRLQSDPRYDWAVAVTQIYYNPTGVIPLRIEGTGTFLNGTVTSSFTIEANITLQMLCNLRDKLAPYLQQQFSDAITAQKPSSVPAGSTLPSMTVNLVQNRWQLILTRFQIDYANSNIEEKLLVPYMGFDTAKRTAETAISSQTNWRRATNSWSPQLCESLYIRAPNIVYTDEFLVYNGNHPETFVPNTIYRVVFDSTRCLTQMV